jgi:hypothetical protein
MTENVTVTKVINQVEIGADGPQGPTGPSGVISVVAPITNTGTSTSAIIGINAGVAGGVATLDGTGKVPQNQLPAVAITNTFVVASQAAMLALTAEEGDVAVRTDLNKSFILTATPSSTLANWQELLTPTDSVLSVDGLTGAVDLTTKYAQLATANTFTGGVQQITTASAATKGLIVKATTSQSANLQEWQNSSSTVMVNVDATGNVNVAGTGYFVASNGIKTKYYLNDNNTGAFLDYANIAGTLSLIQRTTTAVNFVIKSVASQTANLQEWQSSAASILASVSSSGYLRSAVGFASTVDGITYIRTNFDTSGIAVVTQGAAQKALVVRGFASQTANLQEWQNSAGSVLSFVRSDGVMFATSGLQGSAWLSAGSFIAGAQLISNVSTPTSVGVLVRGAASQTASLTQWQNSAGTVVANVDSSGNVRGISVRSISDYSSLLEANSGGYLRLTKQTAASPNPGASLGSLYFRDGTNAGTLKLVVRAGAAGAETTILDNIPQ